MHQLRLGQPLSRRQVLNLIGSMVSSVVVVACTPSGDAPAEANGEVGAPDTQTQDVIFWGMSSIPSTWPQKDLSRRILRSIGFHRIQWIGWTSYKLRWRRIVVVQT